MVAVENIVLQKLHRVLILILRRIFVAVLMERKHRTIVDADLIGDIRQQLISGHGLIYLLQPEIVPGHVLSFKQASGLHVRLRQPHRRQVITEHHNDCFLIPLL